MGMGFVSCSYCYVEVADVFFHLSAIKATELRGHRNERIEQSREA